MSNTTEVIAIKEANSPKHFFPSNNPRNDISDNFIIYIEKGFKIFLPLI